MREEGMRDEGVGDLVVCVPLDRLVGWQLPWRWG